MREFQCALCGRTAVARELLISDHGLACRGCVPHTAKELGIGIEMDAEERLRIREWSPTRRAS